MNSSAMQFGKEQIRMAARTYRSGLTDDQIISISSAITETLLELPIFNSAVTILSYAAITGNREIDTSEINRSIISQNKNLVLPRLESGKKTLQLILTKDLDSLKVNSFKIPEPAVGEDVNLGNIDMIIVPMLAGDEQMNRVGYGAGYYDRLLANFKGITCGLLCDDCLFDKIPAGEYDQALDLIITEKRILKRRK